MWIYLVRRIIALVPTLLGITLVGFVIINLAPGGPIEQKLQQMRFGGAAGGGESAASSMSSVSQQNRQAVNDEVIQALKKQYGFDRPLLARYGIWLKNLSRLDFGNSFTYEEPVTDVILRKFPISMTFGLVSFFLSYLICIPLGILKATKRGSTLDQVSSMLLFMAHSTPSFMLAILLIVLLGGGSFLDWFPITGAVSDHYATLTFWGKVKDRTHHAVLPLICYTLSHFATLTILMKNGLLDELKKDYVRTARAKGLSESKAILKHALRNALIPIATGFGSILTVFFAGSLLIETIFSLDGMGQLGFQAVVSRDYNVVMGLLVIQSFLFLLGNLLSDLLYVWLDPRIDFA